MHVWTSAAATAGLALVLAGCAGSGEQATTEAGAQTTSPAATASSSAPSTGATTSVRDQVRSACQEEVTGRLPGAEFPTDGTLRAASTAGGKTYMISGRAVAGGDHFYSCAIDVIDGEVTPGEILVDGS